MKSGLKKWTIAISVTLCIILISLFCAAELMIGSGVSKYCEQAQAKFRGDRIEALMEMVNCEACTLDDRNHAVWALGQLSDSRALPVLERYYTGEPCNHNYRLCQYELKKALSRVRSGSHYEIAFWKWMLPEDE